MIIKTFTLGELQTNCYFVYDKKTFEGIIIDPADEANFLIEQALALKLKPMSIVATHGHFDHLLASWELTMAFNLPLSINEKDLSILNYMTESASYWLKRKIIEKPPENLKFIKEGDEIIFGGEKLKVIETPGHSPGSICLYQKDILFTGDTLFDGAVGRTDLKYSSKEDLEKSLKKLSKFPDDTIIYPGHGETSTLKNALSRIP